MRLKERSLNINDYLRGIFDTHIRNNFIDVCCYECGSTKDLELHHHSISHNALCKECLDDLGYENKNLVDFTDRDKYILASIYIAKSLEDVKYKTLCNECHRCLHEELGYRKSYYGNDGLTGSEIIEKMKRH